ncbi:LamG-like jellyroll fold domain-containing protein [Cytophaga hutchinsonii]|uniref:CHU large protein uncharacterized n=1 Tax=Cytophaga hutchinsonii (strain ATCC 33406 / DSM 1761 / CIP 103989 / NBRC 15051 / NCIMB 9469 / D465) TaxID=269798 RepID=A0A6N4SR26_CYTH3|nr:LamG-like jellyroll fold domain-containing protein [Cytophaga hutchinsonii]ABG58732.1 CHU large protein; uncharacterized [Cytophaga hutchinsonii ATCC 33406]SFX60636.1 Por secretion system C-terminal sorting domain-containing protein [Cytophaga hutchinsonii ATCC 33406]
MKLKLLLLLAAITVFCQLSYSQGQGSGWVASIGPSPSDPTTKTIISEGPTSINFGQTYNFKARSSIFPQGLVDLSSEYEITECVILWNWYLVKGTIDNPLPAGYQNVASNLLPGHGSSINITIPATTGTYTVVVQAISFSSATPQCSYKCDGKASTYSGYRVTYNEPVNYVCKNNLGRPASGSNSVNGTQSYYSLSPNVQVKVCNIPGSYEGSTSTGWCRRFIWWMSVDGGAPIEVIYGNKLCNGTNTTDSDFDLNVPLLTAVPGTHTYGFTRNYQLIKPNGDVSSNNWSNWTYVTLSTGHMLDYFNFSYTTSTPSCGQTITMSLPTVANANYSWSVQDGSASPATGPSTQVTFNSQGAKNVNVTVTSTDGSFPPKTFTKVMNVQNRIADFTLPALSGNAAATTISVPAQNNVTYTWSVPGAVFNGVPTNVCNIKNFTSAKTGTYSLTITPAAGTCGTAITKTGTINIAHPALQFSGTTYAQVPNSPAFNLGTGNFTMEAWINASNAQVSFPQIMSLRTSGSDGFLFGLFSSGKPFIQMGGSTGNWECGNCADLRDNKCHHIAITRNADVMSFYQDGVLMSSYTVGYATRNIQSTGPLNIGVDAASPGNTYFKGMLHDVRIWNVARSSSEIAANYSSLLAGNEPGLIGNWKMNEGQGQSLLNSAAGSSSATLGTTSATEAADPAWVSYTCNNNNYRTGDNMSMADNAPDDGLGIQEYGETAFTIYPNPVTSGLVYFGKTASEFTLINSEGVVVRKGTNTDKMDVSNLLQGLYILKLDNTAEKIVIQ